ncbi:MULTISPECIES: CcoQ/FixQ family Cbb3-type cytochrome c oxidase assembly chaperone [Salipiger]|uniref:Cytochrome c oxidase, cbb3-type, subunit IV n=1 Tax=Salipiger bermudensis (strain DSM 26914 / JCM 13377 / KCTC 12554 / HTCC2601) TaxID=314265 RepID=Q0FNK7_SALBH|nr:CcoQ/FixQ family Cbb3-type cytochrome c oxidase assembly chaperone [Salipiger bermudensis]MAE90228.1 CcoQ/FixQ family Cbb3-type cytochrome c oxidase assembly chaperone [Pelagibaca sp.]MBR9890987.1 CcoQ/FixQ family Cbb3-type cytochrome c oxidase assembly chaperone [bacterium]EAU45737.1 cytochrome c oxidase, cbb3-type, subunit IV [Salipiger bermudensis HTCC2601]MBN9676530.1 CcoQ/FixQ family Cbb3-type cytochrome c oxidase assembly chaperone [Salipiger bermudensis]MCA1287354.1 CcoQ/FixQ family 
MDPELYNTLRHFADSWGLLAMFVFFLGVIVWALRPGSRKTHEDVANIPFRNEDKPIAPHKADPAQD